VNASAAADQGPRLLALYDRALPQVYGYLAARVNEPAVAEDLNGGDVPSRGSRRSEHKVADLIDRVAHHRFRPQQVGSITGARLEREERTLGLATPPDAGVVDDGIDERFDRLRTREVLCELGAHHRSGADVALPRRAIGP